MKKSLSNLQIIELTNACGAVSDLRGRKFQYAVIRTQQELEKHIKILSKLQETLKEDEWIAQLEEIVDIDIYDFAGELPTGEYITKTKGEDGKETDVTNCNDISLGQVDGLMLMIEKEECGEMKEVEFTRFAVMQYRKLFDSLFSITNPEFVKLFKENLRILKEKSLEVVNSAEVKAYVADYERPYTKAIQKYSKDGKVEGENLTKLEAEFKELSDKHKDVIEAYNAFINEKIKFSIYPVKDEMLWDDIDGKQMSALINFM